MKYDFLDDCVGWIDSDFLPGLVPIRRVLGQCRACTIAHYKVYTVPAAGLVDEPDNVVLKTQLVSRRELVVLKFDSSLVQVVAFSNP